MGSEEGLINPKAGRPAEDVKEEWKRLVREYGGLTGRPKRKAASEAYGWGMSTADLNAEIDRRNYGVEADDDNES